MDTGLNPHWIAKFAQGKIKAPGANRIVILLNYKEKVGRKKL